MRLDRREPLSNCMTAQSTTPAVTLETKCWEGDWRELLVDGKIQLLVQRHRFPFINRVLMINNVEDYSEVCSHAERAVERGWINRYVVVKDHAETALEFFRLSASSLGKGYVYSIAELVSIWICETDYLLHYSGDSAPDACYDWIAEAIELMAADERIVVANLTWNHRYQEAAAESIYETDDFYVGQGFSDQCYLIRTVHFRQAIYNEYNPASERYPRYGGELFEKRVDAWMRNHGRLRATYKRGSYIHPGTPR